MKTINKIWWLNPAYIYMLMLGLVFYAWSMESKMYQDMYGVPKNYINGYYVTLYIINFLFFFIGFKLSKQKHIQENKIPIISIIRFYKKLYYITILATIIWLGNFVRLHGITSLFAFLATDELTKNIYLFREEPGSISGLTTMTEFGPIVASLGAYIYRQTRKTVILKQIYFLLGLTIIRGALFSQRVAFIEILIPFIIVYYSSAKIKKYYNFIPIIAAGALLIVFGIFEYPRSWSTYYINHYDGTFWQYIIDRISGYYTVAINTESLLLYQTSPTYMPFSTLNGFFYLPILNSIEGTQQFREMILNILLKHGNTEFNNTGGMLTAVIDFGEFGLLFSIIYGYLVGLAYKFFIKGNFLGLVVYPVCVYALLEFPRLFYFGGKRGVFVIFAIILVAMKYKKSKT